MRIGLLVALLLVTGTLACSLTSPEVVVVEVTSTPVPQPTATRRPPTDIAPPTEPPPPPSDPAADAMETRVSQLEADGYLASSSGYYAPLANFNETWAQLNWYQWWYTDYAPKDFVLRADTYWDVDSDRANWWNSGCGFVFREVDADNHFVVYLGMDGVVYFSQVKRGNYVDLGSRSYGKVDVPVGQASVLLIVEGPTVHYFVNDKLVMTRRDVEDTGGNLGLTLLSGTNRGFGTRCRMENIDLWVLDGG